MNGTSNGKIMDRRLIQTLAVQFVAATITTALALGAWAYTIGRDVAVLSEKASAQEKRIDRMDTRIGALEKRVWPFNGHWE